MGGQQHYAAIVVGAGVEGRAAARAIATRGRHTLLLEQFALSHSVGSSHGASRITRYSYPAERPVYSRMVQSAMPQWLELQREVAGAEGHLFRQCGLLYVCRAAGGAAPAMCRVLRSLGQSAELLSAGELCTRYPHLDYGPQWEAVFEKGAGVLLADKCMDALLSSFVGAGGTVRDKERVTRVRPSAHTVAVHTEREVYTCDSLVLCLGPYAGEFLRRHLALDLPLQPHLVQALYWRDTSASRCYDIARGMPTMVVDGGVEEHVYALPAMEHGGLFKLCNHDGVPLQLGMDVDEARAKIPPQSVHEQCVRPAMRHAVEHMRHIDASKPEIVVNCIYTRTPTWDPIMDVHPVHKHVVIGAGFSGHGFKLAPAVGDMLADLADGLTERRPEYDLDEFRIPAGALMHSARM